MFLSESDKLHLIIERKQCILRTLTFDALGNKSPKKIGTEVTPVRSLERVQLQNTDISNTYSNGGWVCSGPVGRVSDS